MNEQWQKVNGKICCAAESWALLVLVGNNQIFLFSLLEYGSEERPKNEDVEARKLGASNLLPFCCTNHQSLSNRTLVARSLAGGALAGITILPRFRVCMLRRRENND